MLALPNAMMIATNIAAGNGMLGTNTSTGWVGQHYATLSTPGVNATNIFFSPGQLVEMMGVSTNGERSEALVRSVIDQATVKGDVFSIYTVGQALVQDHSSSGALHVKGERRKELIVERVVSSTGAVKFQPVYSQDLQQ